MEQKSIRAYFQFGTTTRYLQDVSEGYNLKSDGGVIKNIEYFFETLDDLKLQVTKRAAKKLSSLHDRLSQQEGPSISKTDAEKLKTIIRELRQTLHAEIEGFDAYIVTPKRIATEHLINDISGLFAKDVYAKLPQVAAYDIAEAGKCVAFERPTAAAFHILRAAEDVLRSFYEKVVKQKRITSRMWGPIVIDLRKRTAMKNEAALLNNLDNIRASFRNPTQHPEKIYSMDEVQDLIFLCVDVINRMAAFL